jgi:hypothetical protein
MQCVSPATGNRVGVSCVASALIPVVKVPAFANQAVVDGQVQNTFKTGTLNGLFDEIVQDWYYYETNLYLAAQAEDSLSAGFFAVFLEIPSRFITSLGVNFPASLVLSALATRTGLPETSIFNVVTYKSSRSGYSILQFSVKPTGPTVTSASVTAAVIASTPIVFSVTVPGSLPVYLYISNRGETAKAASLSLCHLVVVFHQTLISHPGTIRFIIEHDGLAADLPTMSSTSYNAFKNAVLSALATVGIQTTQILNIDVFVCEPMMWHLLLAHLSCRPMRQTARTVVVLLRQLSLPSPSQAHRLS